MKKSVAVSLFVSAVVYFVLTFMKISSIFFEKQDNGSF